MTNQSKARKAIQDAMDGVFALFTNYEHQLRTADDADSFEETQKGYRDSLLDIMLSLENARDQLDELDH